MNQHTPGPWRAEADGDGGGTIVDGGGFGIADVPLTAVLSGWPEKHPTVAHWARLPGITYRDLTGAEATANARLIAAAPQMLAALRYAQGEACGGCGDCLICTTIEEATK